MISLAERCRNIWETIRQSKARMPTRVVIPDDHVDEGDKPPVAFRCDEHYFAVQVNEMYLTYDRQWFTTFDPMVLVVSEFNYDNRIEPVAVPFVVGPKLMEKYYGENIPKHMIFSDVLVAGPHPYRGGSLNLTVVLYSVKRDDYAKKLLQIVESMPNVLPISTALSTYVKVADVVLDGVEALLGSKNNSPIIGLYKGFNPDAGNPIKPSYFALINMPEDDLNTNELWVCNHQLVYGKNRADAKPFRDADFVLYSITQSSERSDLDKLPFNNLYRRMIKKAINSSTETCWKATKADMTALYQTIRFSPDLTSVHAKGLREKYKNEMIQEHDKAVDASMLGPAVKVDSELREAVSILDL